MSTRGYVHGLIGLWLQAIRLGPPEYVHGWLAQHPRALPQPHLAYASVIGIPAYHSPAFYTRPLRSLLPTPVLPPEIYTYISQITLPTLQILPILQVMKIGNRH